MLFNAYKMLTDTSAAGRAAEPYYRVLWPQVLDRDINKQLVKQTASY